MEKNGLYVLLLLMTINAISYLSMAQEKSISLNYVNIGKGDCGNWNSGVGIQGKIPLKKRLLLMPDAGYIFENVETIYQTANAFNKKSDSYLFANINLAYSINPSGYFNLIPYIGVGYYHDFQKKRVMSKGFQAGGGLPVGTGAPYDVTEEYSTALITANAGLLVEVFITDNIFFTIGCKYMIDTYNGKSYAPYFNAGVGYCF